MRSYADTLSGNKTQGGASATSACFKFTAVMVGLLMIAGAVFVGIRFLPDNDDDTAAASATDASGRSFTPITAPSDPVADDEDDEIATSPSASGGAATSTGSGSGAAATVPALNPAFVKFPNTTTVDQTVMDYQYADALGDTFLFFEAQHSGDVDSNVGGNRIKWRGQQLMKDGADIGVDLSGGMYEAGNRLKITLPLSYMISHMAWICSYYSDTYDSVMYEGRSLLYWCKREVKWGADYLLKMHIFEGNTRPSTWTDDTDSLVIMVGNKKDFNCYDRAELLPREELYVGSGGGEEPLCGVNTRTTLVANATHNAAEVAAYASAAFAASAALLQDDDPQYAVQAMTSAYALYDFGLKHNDTAATWNTDVKETYPVGNSGQFMLYAASMITWAHRCENAQLPLCNDNKARRWLAIAEQQWVYQVEGVPARHEEHMLSNWGNPDYDTALILTAVTGNVSSPYATHLREFIEEYSTANGQVKTTPKGLVRHADEEWSPLRLAYLSSFTALHFSSYPGVDAKTQQTAQCFARGQMGYVLGDNPMEMSYLTGFGAKWTTQVHHRDVACTLQEGLDGECMAPAPDETKMFYEKRANPLTLIGSVVGGPDETDTFEDDRSQYKFTEVALDYNTGVMAGLGAMMSVPADFWDTDCSAVIPKFNFGPYPAKNSDARTSARLRGDDPNEGMDIPEDVALEADIPWDPTSDSSNAAEPEAPLL